MEGFDTEKAGRVWQRVQGGDVPEIAPQEDIAGLLHQSQALAGLYLGLQRRLAGPAASRARALHQQHRRLVAALKGMCLVTGKAVPGLGPLLPGSGEIRRILRSCFHRECRLADAMAARTTQRELGPVWQLLAGQGVKRAGAVLELLGDTEG